MDIVLTCALLLFSFEFSAGNVAAQNLDGQNRVELHRWNETYLVTWPARLVTGLTTGVAGAFLSGTLSVECPQSGFK